MSNQKKEISTIKAECTTHLHEAFKSKCRSKDTNMTDVIIKLVKEYVKAN